MLDKELPQFCMANETAAAAVAKFRADFAHVISRDLDAAQSAMGLCARGAVVDQNEAEHIAPPPGKRFSRHKTDGAVSARLCQWRFPLINGYSRDRHLVIGCMRRSAEEISL
jgi:hypothetical protein